MPDNDLQLSVLKLKPKTKIMMMGTREDDMVRRGRGLLDSESFRQSDQISPKHSSIILEVFYDCFLHSALLLLMVIASFNCALFQVIFAFIFINNWKLPMYNFTRYSDSM